MLLRITLLFAALAGLVAVPSSPPVQAEARPLRVAFLGDSLTFGLHASEPETKYVSLLLQRLAAQTPVGDVLLVYQDPLGMTDDALRRLPAVLDARPDLVILEIGNHEAFAGGEQVDLFEERYDDLLGRLQDTGATVIAGTLTWLNYPRESREYTDALRLNDSIRRLCARRGIAVADLWTPTALRSELIAHPGEPSHVPPYDGDDLHPNDAGHRALADAFWAAYQQDRARRLLRALG
jgi:lysophospholipase L1-like esterase